jgi:signal transduction histidine kinase
MLCRAAKGSRQEIAARSAVLRGADAKAVEVNRFLQEAQRRHEAMAQSRGIELAVDVPQREQVISLDADLLQRAFDHLVASVLKRSAFGSTVTLGVEYPIGADATALAYLIRLHIIEEDPLVQEPTGPDQDELEATAWEQLMDTDGGLGLTFCGMVVDAHGGRVRMRRHGASGAVYTIEI